MANEAIRDIITSNRIRFTQWVAENGSPGDLRIPVEYLGVLIPEPIWRLAKDPTDLHLIVSPMNRRNSSLQFYIVHESDNDVSDPEAFNKLVQDTERLGPHIRKLPHPGLSSFISTRNR